MNQADVIKVATESLRRNVQAAIDAGTSQARLAREAGLSSAALSQWLKGEYKGDNAAVEVKLQAWQDAREALSLAPLPEAPAWIATRTSERILNALVYAQRYHDLALVYGGAGTGKTSTIRHYKEKSPNVWVVTANPTNGTVAAALEAIADALGLRNLSNRPNIIANEIAARLVNARGLLVIDEAQHLNVQALESIRALQDREEVRVGVVLAGNEVVYARISGGSRKATFAQLFSRVGRRVHLVTPLDEDVDAIAKAWGLEGKPEQQLAREIASAPGALRGLTKTLKLAAFAASNLGGKITADVMQAAWADVGGAA